MRFLLEQLKLFFIGAQAEEHGSAHAPQRLPEWADYSSYLATESVRLLESGWPKPKMLFLLQKINASYPLTIQAATGNGWFDLQLTQQSFCGRFPPTTRGYRRARNEFQTIRWQTCRLE